VRAPIFYDSDDTAFYINPNSTSRFSSVQTVGITGIHSGGSTGIDMATNDNYVSMRVIRNSAASTSNDGMYIGYGNSNSGLTRLYGGGATGGAFEKRSDHSFEPGSFRTPIFYDSDDTGYYIDPNTTSRFKRLVLDNGDNLSWGAVYGAGVPTIASTTNTAIYFYPTGSTAGTTFTMFGTYASAVGSMRAPLFYDSNDTNYYVDPNSTSRLYVANVNFLTLLNDEGLNVKGIRGQFTAGSDNQGISLFSNVDIGYPSGWGSGLGNTPSRGLSVYGGLRVAYSGTGFITSDTSVRSPLFYDTDDTAYYLDPASSSYLGIITAKASNDVQLYLNGNGTAWAGINWADVAGNDNIWYNGSGSTFAIGGGGSNVANKKLHVHGGMTIGSGIAASSSGVNNLLVESAITSNQMYSQIFYDSQNGAYYVDPASVSNINSMLTQAAISNNVNGLRNIHPGGGTYVTGASSVSGAIKIKLPETVYPMMRFTVRVYTYDGLSFDIYCGGHTSSALWYNTFAYMTTQNRSALNVRFTGDGTNMYVIIGELAQSWTYPQVFITDVQVGYTNYEYTRWDDGWVISFETSTYHTVGSTHQVFPPTSSTNNVNPAYASIYYDSNNTGYYADAAGTSQFNQLSIAGNSTVFGGYGSGSGPGLAFENQGTFIRFAFHDLDFWDWNYGNSIFRLDNFAASSTSMRAPIFYDSNDTGYYFDGASTSRINQINYTAMYNAADTNYGIVGNNGFFDTLNSGVAGDQLELCYSRGTFTSTSGSMRAPIFYDRDDTSVRWDAGTLVLRNASPTVYFRDTDHNSAMIHVNSNIFYVLRGGNDTETWTTVGSGSWPLEINLTNNNAQFGGIVTAITDMRAPIFYDSADTGYYTDPNSTSYINILGAAGRIYTGYDSGVTNSISCSEWFRSNGSTGWFNASYGGGVYMIDSTYVRVYNGKALYVPNEILATGNITAYYSDERLKTRTGKIENAIDKVKTLDGFYYVENETAKELGYNNDEQQVGLSAQQVQAILPEAVHMAAVDVAVDEDGNKYSKSGEDYLTVDYSRLVPLLIEAIKELKAEIEELKAR
jgi:hypothetical protein